MRLVGRRVAVGLSSESEAYGEVEVRDLPEAGELEVEVTRLVFLLFDEEALSTAAALPRTSNAGSQAESSCCTEERGGLASAVALAQPEFDTKLLAVPQDGHFDRVTGLVLAQG